MSFLPIPDRLTDPFVLRWLVDRIDDAARLGADSRLDALVGLIDGATLRRILTDEELGSGADYTVAASLAPRHVRPHRETLAEIWPALDGAVAARLAAALADPGDADVRPWLAVAVRDPEVRDRPGPIAAVVEAVAQVAAPGDPLFEAAADVRDHEDVFLHPAVLSALTRLAARRSPDAAIDEAMALFARLDPAEDPEDAAWWVHDVWDAVRSALAPEAPDVWPILHRVAAQRSRLSLASFAPLLGDVDLLQRIDRVARQPAARRFLDAWKLLDATGEGSPLARFARGLRRATAGRAAGALRTAVSSVALAALVADGFRRDVDFSALSTVGLVRVATLDVEPFPWEAALREELARRSEDEVIAALSAALSDAEGERGTARVARLMAALGADAFLDPLVDALDIDGEVIEDAVAGALVRFGARAERAIIAAWPRLGGAARVSAEVVLSCIGGAATAEFVAERWPAERADYESLRRLCDLAHAVGALSLVPLVEREIGRRIPFVDDTVLTLSALHGVVRDDRDLLSTRVREAESETAARARRLGEGGVDAADAVVLSLRCAACGDESLHDVPYVWIDAAKDARDAYPGGDVLCRSCGEPGPFSLTPLAWEALVTYMLAVLEADRDDRTVPKTLRPARIPVSGRGELGPGRAIEVLVERTAARPEDPGPWRELAAAYRSLGAVTAADAASARSRALAPDDEPAGSTASTAAPVAVPAADAAPADVSPVGVAPPGAPAQPGLRLVGKVGRNEPCPCGSGRKYKRCCGA